jgi:hypothetical protein
MLSPKTRKPGDGVKFGPRDHSQRMKIQVVVDPAEAIEKELDVDVR